jgi:hypothetical protein
MFLHVSISTVGITVEHSSERSADSDVGELAAVCALGSVQRWLRRLDV